MIYHRHHHLFSNFLVDVPDSHISLPFIYCVFCVGIGGESRLREYHSCLAILESVKEVELSHTFYGREKFALKIFQSPQTKMRMWEPCNISK